VKLVYRGHKKQCYSVGTVHLALPPPAPTIRKLRKARFLPQQHLSTVISSYLIPRRILNNYNLTACCTALCWECPSPSALTSPSSLDLRTCFFIFRSQQPRRSCRSSSCVHKPQGYSRCVLATTAASMLVPYLLLLGAISTIPPLGCPLQSICPNYLIDTAKNLLSELFFILPDTIRVAPSWDWHNAKCNHPVSMSFRSSPTI
jgi:hypothetical protein